MKYLKGYYLQARLGGGLAAKYNDVQQAPGLDDFSISAWIRCSSTVYGDGENADFLIWYATCSDGVSCQFRVRGDTGTPDIYLVKGYEPVIARADAIGSVRVSDESWHHVAATCDRDSQTGLKIYVDGQDVTEGGTLDPTAYADLDLSPASIYAIAYYDMEGIDFGGQCSQMMMFRSVLSPDLVGQIYNNGRGKIVDEAWFSKISDGWYSEIEDGSGAVLTGRALVDGVWETSNFGIEGAPAKINWATGGVPVLRKPRSHARRMMK
jgi:hypothetical protein